VFHRLSADLIVLVHLAFVLFAVLGGLLVLRWRWLAWVHVPAALWAAAIEFAGWICPLTPLENWLRRRAGAGVYEGGFIEHYLLPILYPAALTRRLQIILGLLVIGLNVAVYAWVFLRKRRPRRRGSAGPGV
jgi:hypothetical protein